MLPFLPFVIEPETHQLVELEIALEILRSYHTIVETGLEINTCREETGNLQVQRVLEFHKHRLIGRKIFEHRGPTGVPVDIER